MYGEVRLNAQVRRIRGLNAMIGTIMTNPKFIDRYNGLSNADYVNTLVANSRFAFSAATKNAWIAGLNSASLTRATVLLQLSRNPGYQALLRRRWLVLAGYWGYFRRDPDTAGFNTKLNKIWAGGGNPLKSGIINDFLTSVEYRQRFGPS
jgi:hypothetical protein